MQTDKKSLENILVSLKDFTAPAKDESVLAYSGKAVQFIIDRTDMPVPELLQLIFGGILKLTIYGQKEKLRWEIPFRYKGIHCSFALQKFGLRLYISCANDTDLDCDKLHKEIIGKLKKRIQTIEKTILIPFAQTQIKEGHVTIVNQYHSLENRYVYFREKAEKASKRKLKSKGKNFTEDMQKLLQYNYSRRIDVFYNALAMLDAYFSLLEHLFVLVRPFQNGKPDLVNYISEYWGDKFIKLFDIKKNPTAKSFYDRLDLIKERYRNFYAHGAFEKAGASLYIHFPSLGAIPAQLTRIKNSPHFNFFPIEEDKFKEICTTIDEFNQWLRADSTGLSNVIRYIESGLNIPCDRKSLQQIKTAMKSAKALNSLIEHWSYLDDLHTNMDY